MPIKKTDDLLDWTIHDDLPADAPLPDRPSPAPAPQRPRIARRWLGLGLAAGLVALSPWLYSQWDTWQAERSLRQAVAASDTAAPLPLSLVTLAPDAAELQGMTSAGLNLVQAEVAHAYRAPDGGRVTFSVPQFYQRTADGWQPTARPATLAGARQTSTTPHLKLTYPAVDSELMEAKLAPYLNDVLTRACAAWQCPPEAQAVLDFTAAPTPLALQVPTTATSPSLVLALLAADDLSLEPAHLAAPYLVGRPADDAALDLWKHTLAVKALAQVAQAVMLGRPDTPFESTQRVMRNPFFYALLAREAFGLGVDASAVAELTNTAATPADWAAFWGRRLSPATAPESALALGMLNRWLNTQPDPAQLSAKLLLTLPGLMSEDPTQQLPSWLMHTFQTAGMTADEFFRPLAPAHPPADQIDFVLGCQPALLAYIHGQVQPLLALDSFPLFFWAIDWSPDGRRLALTSFSQSLVLDLATGGLFWPPTTPGSNNLTYPAMWLSDTRLAYNEIPSVPPGQQLEQDQIQLKWIDPQNPATLAIGPSGVFAFPGYLQPAPDGRRAAVLQQPIGAEKPLGSLSVLTLADGALTPVAQLAYPPVWAASGRELTFLKLQGGGLAWQRFNVAGGGTAVQFWPGIVVDAAPVPARFAMSPDGQWLMLAQYDAQTAQSVVRRLAANGAPAVDIARFEGVAGSLSLSPDGRQMAVSIEAAGLSRLVIYDAATGGQLASVDGLWSRLIWSPHADQLLAVGENGTYLLSRTGTETMRATRLTTDACAAAAWRPGL